VSELRTAHTSDLDAATLEAARALLYEVFDDAGDPMTEEDWEHCLGGIHALVLEDGDVIAHAAVVQRRLIHQGRALRTGYVEGVAVRRDRQRRGHGAALMEAVERVIRGAYDIGALGASEEGELLYVARGWVPWRGTTFALTPDGVRRTPDEDDCTFVLPVTVELDLEGELTCDWRDGEVW
jgi:aminoglycoside 2'-N-acetyltransferase I